MTTLDATILFSTNAENIKKVIRDLQSNLDKANFQIKSAEGQINKGETDKLKRLNDLKSIISRDTGGINDKDKKFKAELLGIGSSVSKAVSGGLITLTKKSIEVFQRTYELLKKNSPLLQAVENLFNIAMQLFFMPLGNKLGEVLIPAVIKLMDDVTALWDEYGDGGLGEMFNIALTKGVEILADFLNNIGDTLESEGGILGSVGRALNGLSRFVERHLGQLIEIVFKIADVVINNLPLIIFSIGEFMTLSVSLALAEMAVIAASADLSGKITGGLAASAIIAGVAGTGASAYAGSLFMAEGGYVPATSGGQLRVLGEGGEGEYVIPESKMGRFGNVTNNFYGLTDGELEEKIKRTVNDQIAQSRMRGNF